MITNMVPLPLVPCSPEVNWYLHSPSPKYFFPKVKSQSWLSSTSKKQDVLQENPGGIPFIFASIWKQAHSYHRGTQGNTPPETALPPH